MGRGLLATDVGSSATGGVSGVLSLGAVSFGADSTGAPANEAVTSSGVFVGSGGVSAEIGFTGDVGSVVLFSTVSFGSF